MSKFLFKFIIFFSLLSSSHAQNKESGYIVLPSASFYKDKKYTAQEILEIYKGFYNSQEGREVMGHMGVQTTSGYVSLDGFSNNAQDTKQVRCYRCALGQSIKPSDQSWCNDNYGFWNISKEKAKSECH